MAVDGMHHTINMRCGYDAACVGQQECQNYEHGQVLHACDGLTNREDDTGVATSEVA